MTTLDYTDLEKEEVNIGAKWMDEHYPGWAYNVDINELKMLEPCQCIIGQQPGLDWLVQIKKIQEDLDGTAFSQYDELWIEEIKKRTGDKWL